MHKTEFLQELAAKAELTEEQAVQVSEILESHHIIGKNSKLAVIAEIGEKLGVDAETAERISDTASQLIASGIKNRLLHPFGSDRDEKK